MSCHAVLPQELLDQVVECLAAEYSLLQRSKRTSAERDGTLNALINCSRASSALYYRATSSLYSRTHILASSDMAPKRFASLLQILTPSIATTSTGVRLGPQHHIQNFSVTLYGQDCLGHGGIDQTCPAHRDALKALNDEKIALILNKLHAAEHGITNLQLTWATSCCPISWTDFSPRFQRSLHDLILSPRLHGLGLTGQFSNIPGSIFSGTTLRDLRVDSLHREWDIDQAEATILDAVCLPNIECFHTNYSFTINISPPSSPLVQLKELKAINVVLAHLPRTESILRLAHNSLQAITLEFYVSHSRFSIDFGSMPNLKRLSIIQERDVFLTPITANDPVINALFDTLEGNPPLANLVLLELQFRLVGIYGPPEPYVPDPSNSGSVSCWERLDGIISTTHRFPVLKEFHINLSMETILNIEDSNSTLTSTFQGVRSTFKTSFPRVSSSRTILSKITLNGRLNERTSPDSYRLIPDTEDDTWEEVNLPEM